ncbi:EF-hand domain-containing protein [Nonomuraea sp. NBC_01738]|uniref:EF-hand domain-containing protein n=1 Tax=Nonomuraea sp. NBC_01738 TaxID=2976003 RepID=UPI002E141991|nr:EF-hand domain-containing protein [Nonomuraea sp. NBC_01738]
MNLEGDDLLNRKFDVCFGHGDVNGDGILERADCVALGARLVAYLDEPFDSPKALALFETFGRFWARLIDEFDDDGSGGLSPEEFRQGMRGAWVEDGGGFEAAFRPAAAALWQLCDKDGDGMVGAREFARFHTAFGTSAHNSRVSFEKLDRDGDGNLSVEELIDAWREYYTSADPDSPGNWLYGDIWQESIWDGTRVKL